jgi:hypothetical protein
MKKRQHLATSASSAMFIALSFAGGLCPSHWVGVQRTFARLAPPFANYCRLGRL